MEQAVMNFAGTAARNSALSSVQSAGMMAHVGAGTVTVYDGSAWQQVYPVTAGLIKITDQTIGAAVSTITVSNVFSSSYDSYKIIITAGTASSSNTQITLQLGTANTNYFWAGLTANQLAGVTGAGASTAVTSWTLADPNNNAIYLEAEVHNPNLASYTWFSSRSYNEANKNMRLYTGYQASTTAFTAFTLAPITGTLTGGKIRVYGYGN